MKVIILLCSITLARAGIVAIDNNVIPATASPLFTPVVTKTITPITKTYNPYYDSVLTTHESKSRTLDGTEHRTFTKSLDTPYGSVKKFEYRTTNDGYLGHPTVYSTPIPLHSTVVAQPNFISTPLIAGHTSGYHSPTAPVIAKTISTPAVSYRAPVITKTISPIVQTQPAIKVTYSAAPIVSHMSFTGHGTSYSW